MVLQAIGTGGHTLLLCRLLRLEPGYLILPAPRIGGFRDQRDTVKAWIAHDPAERRIADIAFPEALVPINPAVESAFRIVEVHAAQVTKADGAENWARSPAGGLIAQIIACGEGMTGIDTDPNARFVLDLLNNGRQLLEAEPRLLP